MTKALDIFGYVIHQISRGINSIGMAVLVAMMLLITGDVVLRYVFNMPIPGAYETTGFMMAILCGFAFAYGGWHKSHVSVDLVTSKLSKRAQATIGSITFFISFAICALIAWRTFSYALQAQAGGLVSQTTFVPISPFVYLVAFGFTMLCLVFLYNFLTNLVQVIQGARHLVWIGLVFLMLVVFALFSFPLWGKAILQMEPTTAGVIGIIIMICLIFSGMPIGVVMAVVGFLGMSYIIGLNSGLSSVNTTPYSVSSAYAYNIIPLFVLMGTFCFYSGLSSNLYNMAYKWLGGLPGGLAMATIGACAGFAAVTGSSFATVATIGTVALPEMKKYRYSQALATGSIAAGGCLGILIPPSAVMIVYGILTEQSIGKLFLAGFLPGLLQAFLFIVTIYILCKINPSMGPRGASTSFKEKVISLKGAWEVLVLFILVIGGMYLGIFTASEAAAVGAFGAFVFALAKRQLTWKNFVDSLIETSKTTAMIMFILVGADIMGYFLAVTRLPFELSNYVAGLQVDRMVILIIILIFYIVLGCVLNALPMIVLTVPILFPLVTALHFDPIWFGVIITMMVEMGQITPPVGMNVYVMKGIAKDVPMFTIFRGIVPFLYADVVHIILIISFPQIALWLPSMMK
jgi:C4-dicarboxylate transporter DctM subunit